MPSTKQLKGAYERLLAIKPKPKKPLKIEVEPRAVPEEDAHVISWEDMEIEQAKKSVEETSIEDQLASFEEADEFMGAMDSAGQMLKQAEQVYGNEPRLPKTIKDPSILRSSLGPAYAKLVHFSSDAIEDMAHIARQNSKSRAFLTTITDEAVHLVTPKNSMFIGKPNNIVDSINEYSSETGFRFFPRLPASVDAAGDIVIEAPAYIDTQAWNSAMTMVGIGFNKEIPRYIPLVLDFDTPLLEYTKLSGRVKMYDDGGNAIDVTGINALPLKRGAAKKPIVPSNSMWVDEPLGDVKDAKSRVAVLFDDVSGKAAYWRWKLQRPQSSADLRTKVWKELVDHATKETMPQEHEEFFRRSRASFWPKDDAGDPMLYEWFPKGSNGLKAVMEFTKNTLYKARLVDASAPKDAPMILARGAQGGWEFVDKNGQRILQPTLDPKLANEFGENMGSLSQAEHFALRGAIHGAGVFPPYRREFETLQIVGRRVVGKAISGDPKIKDLWDTFLDDVGTKTNWGRKAPAKGWAEDIFVIERPNNTTIDDVAYTLLLEPQYTPLKEAIKRAAGGEELRAITLAASIIKKGNANIQLYVTNAQRPLMMWDTGGFNMISFIKQLMEKEEFVDEMPMLTDALRAADDMLFNFTDPDKQFSLMANVEIRKMLKRKGYDHIAYINAYEFPGTPSFIFFDPNTVRPIESFGEPKASTKLLMGPSVAVGLAFRLSGESEKEESDDDAHIS